MISYWDCLEMAAEEVNSNAVLVCRRARIPESTRKGLPSVTLPHRRTREKILNTLLSLGWEKQIGLLTC